MAWTVAAPPVSELLDADAELEEEEDDDEEEEEEEAEAVEFPLELLLQVGWSGKSLIPTPLQSFWVNLMTSERRNELVCLREREKERDCVCRTFCLVHCALLLKTAGDTHQELLVLAGTFGIKVLAVVRGTTSPAFFLYSDIPISERRGTIAQGWRMEW